MVHDYNPPEVTEGIRRKYKKTLKFAKTKNTLRSKMWMLNDKTDLNQLVLPLNLQFVSKK